MKQNTFNIVLGTHISLVNSPALTPVPNFSKCISSHLKEGGSHLWFFRKKEKKKLTYVNFQISRQEQTCQPTSVWILSSLRTLPSLDPHFCLTLHYRLLLPYPIYFTSFFQADNCNSFVFWKCLLYVAQADFKFTFLLPLLRGARI